MPFLLTVFIFANTQTFEPTIVHQTMKTHYTNVGCKEAAAKIDEKFRKTYIKPETVKWVISCKPATEVDI